MDINVAFNGIRGAVFESKVNGESFYSSIGGTFWAVVLAGEIYGLIPKHVTGDFDPTDLLLSRSQDGDSMAAKPTLAVMMKSNRKETAESEIEDVVLCKWSGLTAENFGPNLIDIDTAPIGQSQAGDEVAIIGLIKDGCDYSNDMIKLNFHTFSGVESGESSVEHLRTVRGTVIDGVAPESLTGMSGGMIWNHSRQQIAGMILRAGIMGRDYIFHYLPYELLAYMCRRWAQRLRDNRLV